MNEKKGAMSIAENLVDFKTDVEVILSDERKVRNYVLRTTFNKLSDWKAKHVNANMSVFEKKLPTTSKEAAIIDEEVWVYGIDSIKKNDVVAAVKIAMGYYKVAAKEIISNVYVKNMNAEKEGQYNRTELVAANKKLYQGVCETLIAAAKELGVTGEIEFMIFSHNLNHKIPQQDLYDALKEGGSDSVILDK